MSRLDPYRSKRDFDITPEPPAELAPTQARALSFVVQKHDASRLHYDFRLEWQGVLLSWAVTKGPSTDPGEKRLAVRTEDHPVSYGTFEGTIPEGQYGGGTVMLWDEGWWEPLHDPEEGLRKGKLHFRLHGARMEGGWVLVRMRGKAGEKRENWLLIKEADDHAGRSADALTNKYRKSVTTGRTMRAIAANKPVQPPARHDAPRPPFRKLQLATLEESPPKGDDWQHEVKFDGYRCLVALGKGGARLYTRNGNDWTDRFGALCDAVEAIPCRSALIDGEVIAGGEGGDFSALQAALKEGGDLSFYAFDLLALDGDDLTNKPLSDRRQALEDLLDTLPPRGPVRLSPVIEAAGQDALDAMCRMGGEGIISKRRNASYRGGRGRNWIKAKCIRRAEFVIVGYAPSDKPGRPFASLLLGSYESGRLIYRGRVGTGFDARDMQALERTMRKLTRKTAPTDDDDLPSETRGAQWLRPELVAEVAYGEFTADGRIRHGVFKGLREDKPVQSVSVEREAQMDGQDNDLTIGNVHISSSGRVVFPEAGLTKGDVARHFNLVAERMLESLSDRPVSLLRCPEGISEECFFQRHAGKGFPDAVKAVPITEKDGDTEDYMYLSTVEGLLGAVQMGTLEFHGWGVRRDNLEKPDRMIFDLDPDEGLGFDAVRDAAKELRAGLAACGLESGVMLTGGKGVHVIVPLRRIAEWDTVKAFSRSFAAILAERAPERYTATMSKAKRKGRIFIDWLRNERGATAITPYSLRARSGGPVATPITWTELKDATRADAFHPPDMKARLSGACPLQEVPLGSISQDTVAKLEDWMRDG